MEELMEYQRENERLEEHLAICQREIRRLRDLARGYDWERRKLEEFIQSKIQAEDTDSSLVKHLQEIYDYMQQLQEDE